MIPIAIRNKLDHAIGSIASDLPPGTVIAILVHHTFQETPPGYHIRYVIDEPVETRLDALARIAELP